jgi:hypothetical protein
MPAYQGTGLRALPCAGSASLGDDRFHGPRHHKWRDRNGERKSRPRGGSSRERFGMNAIVAIESADPTAGC